MKSNKYLPLEGSRASARLAPVLAVLLAVLWPADTLFATPTAPIVLVNHETRECGQAIQGDECSWCEPAAGWEILGPAGQASCPEGYARVDRPAMDCRRYETPFCCWGGVHRGDCEDMVIDEGAGLCGFVDELEGCTLPANWLGRPADVEPQAWACPAGYSWAPEVVACLAAQVTPGTPDSEPQAQTPESEAPATVPAEDTEEAWRGICFGLSCLVLVAVLFGFAAMFPVWYVQRQQERRTLPPSSKQ